MVLSIKTLFRIIGNTLKPTPRIILLPFVVTSYKKIVAPEPPHQNDRREGNLEMVDPWVDER